MNCLMGIDLGTSSVKCLLVTEQGDKVSSYSVDYDISVPHSGYAEQSPRMWWDSTVQCIAAVLKKSGVHSNEILGIGLSGQMHGTVLLDRQNRVLYPAILHCDGRSKPELDELFQSFAPDYFAKINFNPLFSGSQPASLLWMKRHCPEIYPQIARVLLPKDYIRFCLTGEIGTELTDASGSLFLDLRERRWSRGIIEQFGLSEEQFPPIHNSEEIAGYIMEEAAVQTGLNKGTPVVFGAGDQSAQALGNGVIHPGTATSNIGTAGQIFTPTATPIYNPKLSTNSFCHLQDRWYVMGAILNAGLAVKWVTSQVIRNESLQELDRLAAGREYIEKSPVFLPYLCGERTPYMNPNAKGMFFGLTLEHSYLHIYHAVMEGVVFALKDSIAELVALGIRIDRIIASGGGARSDLWLQMQADIFNSEISTTASGDQANLGAAILAAVGCGVYSNIGEAAAEMVKTGDRRACPVAEHVALYQEKYQTYRSLYSRVADLY